MTKTPGIAKCPVVLTAAALAMLFAARGPACAADAPTEEQIVKALTPTTTYRSLTLTPGVRVRLRYVVVGVRALTICSSVGASAAQAGPRAAKSIAKAAAVKTTGHLAIPGVLVI